MNRDQTAIVATMLSEGWQPLISGFEAMRMGDVFAGIHVERTIRVYRMVGDKPDDIFCVRGYKGRGWLNLAVSIATAAAKTKLTSEQFGDILHAIGGGVGKYARPGYRNFYDAGENDRPALDALVEGGYMTKHSAVAYYYVTDKGAAEVGCAGCLESK